MCRDEPRPPQETNRARMSVPDASRRSHQPATYEIRTTNGAVLCAVLCIACLFVSRQLCARTRARVCVCSLEQCFCLCFDWPDEVFRRHLLRDLAPLCSVIHIGLLVVGSSVSLTKCVCCQYQTPSPSGVKQRSHVRVRIVHTGPQHAVRPGGTMLVKTRGCIQLP